MGQEMFNTPKVEKKAPKTGVFADDLEERGPEFVIENHDSYYEDTDGKITHRLIDAGHADAVADNIRRFPSVHHEHIAENLIAAGHADAVAGNLRDFNVSWEILDLLIKEGHAEAVAGNLDCFTYLTGVTANYLIKGGYAAAVAENLPNFRDLRSSTVDLLIEEGCADAVADNLGTHFRNPTEAADVSPVFQFIFMNLTGNTARRLIDAGHADAVADNIRRFKNEDHTALGEKLIERGYIDAVVRNHKSFIHSIGKSLRTVAYHSRFTNLTDSIADRLINAGYLDVLTTGNPSEVFANLTDATALRIIKMTGDTHGVASNLGIFTNLTNFTAQQLINEGRSSEVANHLGSFYALEGDMAFRFLEEGRRDSVHFRTLVRNICENLAIFRKLNHTAFAQRLIELGEIDTLAEHLPYFRDLTGDIAVELITQGHVDPVVDHPDSFNDRLRDEE